MVEALIRGLEGGGDNGGYILGMCNDLLLDASYSDPKKNLSHFGRLKVWYYLFSLSIQTGVFDETLRITLLLCSKFYFFIFYFLVQKTLSIAKVTTRTYSWTPHPHITLSIVRQII